MNSFSVDFTDWESMMATDGSGSRPAATRSSLRRASLIAPPRPILLETSMIPIAHPKVGQVMGHGAPGHPFAGHIEDAIEHLAHIHPPGRTARFGGGISGAMGAHC